MIKGSRTDEVFTLLFMLLAIAAVVCFFAVKGHLVFYICGIAAVVVRVLQYILRYLK